MPPHSFRILYAKIAEQIELLTEADTILGDALATTINRDALELPAA